jgi:hypothetical protein
MRMISILLGAEFDGNMRGGADHAQASIGIAVASERLQEQKEFLGQHRRCPSRNRIFLMHLGERLENSIK